MIDIYHKDGAVSDIATSRDIRHAALAIFGECMQPSHEWSGGYVRDIGKDTINQIITPFKSRLTDSVLARSIQKLGFSRHTIQARCVLFWENSTKP